MEKAFKIFFYASLTAIAIKVVAGCVPPAASSLVSVPKAIETNNPVRPNALKNMFGINCYEWNFLNNPNDPNDAGHVYGPKMDLIKCFTNMRHYLDWEKIEETPGNYTFNPTTNGSWNFDAIYQACKEQNILVLACLKTCPPWLVNTYPADQRDNENVPAPYGLNRSDPASYALQAKAAFQFAARYGHNKNVNPALVKVNTKPRWTGDPVNIPKIGMGLIDYIECDNERDKWWKGKKAQQTGREYAANLSAFYDGNKGKLGKNAGVKTADPNMKVVMCGLASADVKFVQDMISWCKENRGYNPDGSINLCFDVINYHYAPNDGKQHLDKQATRGMAPELTDAAKTADDFVRLADNLKQRPEVWITETCYDINPGSPQRAMQIGDKPALITQADWLLRAVLLYNRHGIKRSFFYQLFDDNTSSIQYGTSGLADGNTLKRRPAADYMLQTNKLMGNYVYTQTICQNPIVDVYTSGTKKMYILMVPEEKGKIVDYQLNLGNSKSAVIHRLQAGSDAMISMTVKGGNGKINLPVTETPVFVEVL